MRSERHLHSLLLRDHCEVALFKHVNLLLVRLERVAALLRQLLRALRVLLEQIVCLSKAEQTLDKCTVVRDESLYPHHEVLDSEGTGRLSGSPLRIVQSLERPNVHLGQRCVAAARQNGAGCAAAWSDAACTELVGASLWGG